MSSDIEGQDLACLVRVLALVNKKDVKEFVLFQGQIEDVKAVS